MKTLKKLRICFLLTISGVLVLATDGFGYQINDMFSIGGVVAGIYQYESLSDAPGYDSLGRGLLAIQPEVSFSPTEQDELFVKFGFGAGNGFMEEGKSPFILATWGGDTQDGVKDINGRGRDYLLTAWYKHTFKFGEDHTLGLTGGLIDATDYLDENAFSNDEYTQFMNQALVNGPHCFLPSYDIGGAVEWEIGRFSIKGAAMALGSNGEEGEFEEPYNFFGVQFGYKVDFGMGEGNYRLLVDTTSSDFSNVSATKKERLSAATLSFDQQLGDILGAWIRFGWQDDKAAVDYKDLYSGGLNISGNLWGRAQDNIGIGYAHLRGGNLEVDKTDVFEVYGRFGLNEIFAVTGDVQYMKDTLKEGDSPKGWIFGVRLTAEF
jgi:porin